MGGGRSRGATSTFPKCPRPSTEMQLKSSILRRLLEDQKIKGRTGRGETSETKKKKKTGVTVEDGGKLLLLLQPPGSGSWLESPVRDKPQKLN